MPISKNRILKSLDTNNHDDKVWTPNPDSFHYRVYQKWRFRRGGIKHENPSVYRYLRIVYIWAPIEAAKPVLVFMLATFGLLSLVGSLAYLAMDIVINDRLLLVCASLLIVYGFVGMTAWGVYLYFPGITSWNSNIKYFVFPPMVMTAIFVYIGKYLVIFTTWLHKRFDLYRRTGRAIKSAVTWSFATRLSSHKWLGWVRPILLVPAAVGTISFWHPDVLSVLGYIALSVSGPALLLALIYFGNISDLNYDLRIQRQKEAVAAYRDAELNTFLRRLFELQHPKYVRDEAYYDKWLTRYRVWFGRFTQYEERRWYSLPTHLSISSSLRDRYESIYGSPDGMINVFPVIESQLKNNRELRFNDFFKKFIKIFAPVRRRTN